MSEFPRTRTPKWNHSEKSKATDANVLLLLFFLRQINYWFRLFSQQIESNVPIKLKFAVLISVNRSECALSPEFGKQSKQPKKTTERETTLRVKCTQWLRIAPIDASRDRSNLPAINRSSDVLTTNHMISRFIRLEDWFFSSDISVLVSPEIHPGQHFVSNFTSSSCPLKFVSKKNNK